jgi:sugar/nucleoside kinase (ribokinase family)
VTSSVQHNLLLIGNAQGDLIIGPMDNWPEPGTETIYPLSDFRPGGSAGNTALALNALRMPYRLISAVGNDNNGRWLMQTFGMQGKPWEVIDAPTTVSVGIVHKNKERTFLTTTGHLDAFASEHILAGLQEIPTGGGTALLAGVFLSPPLIKEYDSLIDKLASRGYTLAIDTGWPDGGWTEEIRSTVMGWFERCGHILINDKEAEALTGEADPRKAAQKLVDNLPGKCTVIIKCGADGALAQKGGALHQAAAPVIDPFDTIGAGDGFNGGYLYGLLRNGDLEYALRCGVVTASTAVNSFPRRYLDAKELAAHLSCDCYKKYETESPRP